MRTFAWVLVGLLACGSKDAGSEGGETASSGSTGGDASGGSTGAADAGSGDGSGTGEPTGGGGACDPFCDKLVACGLDGAFEGCPCNADLGGAKCLARWDEATQCFAAATCAALQNEEGPCWSLFLGAYEQCSAGEDGCELYLVGGGPDDGTCTFGQECVDAPNLELHCDDATCTCTSDGAPAGSCPADGVCDALDGDLAAKIAACCD